MRATKIGLGNCPKDKEAHDEPLAPYMDHPAFYLLRLLHRGVDDDLQKIK